MSKLFDDTTKAFYRAFFIRQGVWAVPEYHVYTRAKSIDLVVECQPKDAIRLQGGRFAHFQQVNAVEFKGDNDGLTPIDFNRILMRAWGIGARDVSQEIADDPTQSIHYTVDQIARFEVERTVTIVCVTKPVTVLVDLFEKFGFTETSETGVYFSEKRGLPVWIIHPSELALIPKNYPLLPLAKGKTLEQFIQLCLSEGLVDYLQLVFDVGMLTDPEAVWQKIQEMLRMGQIIREETWPYVDYFLQAVPEAMQKLPTLREAIEAAQALSREEGREEGREVGREEGREEGREVGREEGREEGREVGRQQGQVDTLVDTITLTLAVRFGADKRVWLPRLAGLALPTLQQLNESALLVQTLAAFEARFDSLTQGDDSGL